MGWYYDNIFIYSINFFLPWQASTLSQNLQALKSQTQRTKISTCNSGSHSRSVEWTDRTFRSREIKHLQKKIVVKFQNINSQLKKNSEMEGKFKNITNELKRTNKTLNNRKFRRKIPVIKTCNLELTTPSSSFYVNDEKVQNSFKTFDEFIFSKRKQNVYLKTKMKIFGNTISDHEKTLLQNDIRYQTSKLLSPETQVRYKGRKLSSIDKEGIQRKSKYVISHMILEKFLEIISRNPENIQLKNEYFEVYKKLKEQMISIILDEDNLFDKLHQLDKYITEKMNHKFSFTPRHWKSLLKMRKPFYLLQEKKKDETVDQIQKLLETSKNLIVNSLMEFNSPEIASQLRRAWKNTFKIANDEQ